MAILFDMFKETTQRFSKKIAIISEEKQYSYQVLLEQCQIWAKRLIRLAPHEDLCVALLTEEAINTAALSLAVAKLNAICIPTNPQLTNLQLIDGWLATDVNIVIYEPAFAHKILQCQQLGQSQHMVFISTDNVKGLPHTAIETLQQVNEEKQNDLNNLDKQNYIITLSSGSTGSPKPIALSQQAKVKRAQQSWQLYQIQSSDVVLCASPFFHSLGQRLFFVPLLLGCTLVQLKQFTPKAWLTAAEQHKVSKVISVSSHLYALKDELLNNANQLKSLKTIVTSSAPIDAHFKEQLFKAIGCDFHEMYGASEVATCSNLFPEFAQQKYKSVGTACPNVEIKILDKNKTELAVNEIGEIAIKSPLAFNGYYKRETLTNNSLHNGYFLTGDLGQISSDGFLTYVGREKDIIISGGINIYPKDIESIIATHPKIKETAVIGLDDSFLGEVIISVCVIDGKDNTSSPAEIERELHRLANKKLASFQRPLKYFFPDELPLTATGKISKIALREQYNALEEDWSAALRALFYR